MPQLLFIKHKVFNARTVEDDIYILSEIFKVKMKEVNTTKGINFFTALIYQYFYLLFNIYKYKIIFIWFADYHSLLPVFFSKMFNKICIINIGGYDADEILIGNPKSLKEKFRKYCVSYSVNNASKLFPVSNLMKSHLVKYVNPAKCETIYCCIDTDKFTPPEEIPDKENIIVTVGGGGDYIKEAKRKRLDYFIELGEKFNSLYPGYNTKFIAIGHDKDTNTYKYLSELITCSNIELKPMTRSVQELIDYYKNASIYMQLSYFEAFGIAQVEAMLYGCIPISNNGGAISEVIGDAGFIIDNYDTDIYVAKIKEVLDKKHENLRALASHRALNSFSLNTRKAKLLAAIETLLKK